MEVKEGRLIFVPKTSLYDGPDGPYRQGFSEIIGPVSAERLEGVLKALEMSCGPNTRVLVIPATVRILNPRV